MAALTPRLPEALEAELDRIRSEPRRSIGQGEKVWLPYEPTVARLLVSVDDPAVTERLQAEMAHADRVTRLALLQVIGRRADDRVDGVLLEALEDPELRATAAYLLGRAGDKGYPARERDVPAIRAALRRYLDDAGTFEDPFSRQTFRVSDFVLAAYVRLSGPERFRFSNVSRQDMVGYELPRLDDDRDALLAQARAQG
jgi:hypothetical protein